MKLICADNQVYDHNPKAMIRIKNFWGEWSTDFTIDSNQVCLDMGKFIEQAHSAVDEKRPFLIKLDREQGSVARIVYPDIDPLSLDGDLRDLLPKKVENPVELELIDVKTNLD